jgi:hypothetical protein
MSDDPIDTYGIDPADGDRSYERWLNQAALIDWPARFRAAAEVAAREGWSNTALTLRGLAQNDQVHPDVVEAIGRALLGETS